VGSRRARSLDHDDPEGERTLAALGGAPNGCVEVLDVWSRRRRDLRALTLASRGPADPLVVERPDPGGSAGTSVVTGAPRRPPMPARYGGSSVVFASSSAGGGGWSSYRAVARAGATGTQGNPAPADPADDYSMLFGLGGGLADRLAATVAAHWAERIDSGEVAAADAPALYAALAGRVWVAVRAWLGDPYADVHVHMTAPDEAPVAQRDGDRWMLGLPFRWLSRVWAPSLAVVAGRLVLDVDRVDGSLTLTALMPGSDQPSGMTLQV
jgi:hypothetical protein